MVTVLAGGVVDCLFRLLLSSRSSAGVVAEVQGLNAYTGSGLHRRSYYLCNLFFFLLYGNSEIFLFNRYFTNIRFVDHFDQLLNLLEIHLFQFIMYFGLIQGG